MSIIIVLLCLLIICLQHTAKHCRAVSAAASQFFNVVNFSHATYWWLCAVRILMLRRYCESGVLHFVGAVSLCVFLGASFFSWLVPSHCVCLFSPRFCNGAVPLFVFLGAFIGVVSLCVFLRVNIFLEMQCLCVCMPWRFFCLCGTQRFLFVSVSLMQVKFLWAKSYDVEFLDVLLAGLGFWILELCHLLLAGQESGFAIV